MKVKHLVTYTLIVVNLLITIVGLINGWIEEKPTPLGLLTVLMLLIDVIAIVIFIAKNWDRKIF